MLQRFFARYFPAGFEGFRLPDLEFVAQADKSDLGCETRVRAKVFRNDDTAVTVDRENLDVAVECDREFVPLIRIVRQASEKPVDLLRKSFAATIKGRSVDRGVAIDAEAPAPR